MSCPTRFLTLAQSLNKLCQSRIVLTCLLEHPAIAVVAESLKIILVDTIHRVRQFSVVRCWQADLDGLSMDFLYRCNDLWRSPKSFKKGFEVALERLEPPDEVIRDHLGGQLLHLNAPVTIMRPTPSVDKTNEIPK